jgi:hypothetical protein
MKSPSNKRNDRQASRDASDSNRGQSPASTDPVSARPLYAMRIIEWMLLGIFCLILLYLHVVLYQNAGAFWRDEASSIQLAKSSSLSEMWTMLTTDSAPPLFAVLLRTWIIAGPGGSDEGIRLFGTLIALGLVASVFVSSYLLTRGVPLLAVSLTAMNIIIFYFGSSIRSYGLAALLIVLCFTAIWKVVRSPTALNCIAALILAILSVYCNYHNCYLLFGIGIAGAIACAVCRLWKRSLLVLTICFITMLSMLALLPVIIENRDIEMVTTISSDLSAVVLIFVEAFTLGEFKLYVFRGLALLSAFVFLPYLYLSEKRSRTDCQTPSVYLYSLIVLIAGTAGGITFLYTSRMFPCLWHFIPFAALAAVIVEIGVFFPRPNVWLSGVKAALAVAIVGVSVMPIWYTAGLRRTNLDLACNILAEKAAPNDLILVNLRLYWLSPGFDLLYHGQVPWTTIPILPDDRFSRLAPWMRIKEIMETPDAIKPTLDKIESTLRLGNRVWIVGAIQLPPIGAPPKRLPPAPLPDSGWNCIPYTENWSSEVAHFLMENVEQLIKCDIPSKQPVSTLEDVQLFYAHGWR